ncbi:hypothetical protein PaecuDRAFT_3015 [Paenibacillus curdlanolyticus YK9]|uniref:Uncharacterized protein n=1 Tax=Paenibacillus curdlanolyticus YK9 TaxID=717606 RepID=E0IBH6_9BACL|nr:hypothetical protein PaecuDRAFT_3015 [Paenibacillus curdlanolyticus YK9]
MRSSAKAGPIGQEYVPYARSSAKAGPIGQEYVPYMRFVMIAGIIVSRLASLAILRQETAPSAHMRAVFYCKMG